MEFLRRYKNKKITLGILGALASIGIPLVTRAGWIDNTMSEVVLWTFRIVFVFFNYTFVILLAIGNFLVGVMLRLNFEILDSSRNSLVYVGWAILRDIANLGFVLIIIVIGIATILRFKEYGAQSLLPRLIAAAILVNFSLAIAGKAIDFSHAFTHFFMDRVGGTVAMTDKIISAFAPHRFFLEDAGPPLPPDPDEGTGAFSALSAKVLETMAAMLFAGLFTLLTAVVMLALAFMLLVRFVYLSFLLIMAPVVWLFWVVPSLRSHWSKWWNKFLQWTFFAPIVSFFIYLSLISAERLGDTGKDILGGVGLGATLTNLITQGSQMVILAGILIGGLIAAQSMGIHGAGAAIKAAKGAGKAYGKRVGKQWQRGAQWAGKRGGAFGWKPKFLGGGTLGEWGGGKIKNAGAFLQKTPTSTLGKTLHFPFKGVAERSGKWFERAGGSVEMKSGLAAKDIDPGSLMGTVWAGAIKGSGVFRGKHRESKWACNICGRVVSSTEKPKVVCQNKGSELTENVPELALLKGDMHPPDGTDKRTNEWNEVSENTRGGSGGGTP